MLFGRRFVCFSLGFFLSVFCPLPRPVSCCFCWLFLPRAMFFLAVFLLACVVCFPLFCLLCCACYTGCLCGLATVAVCCPGFPQPTFPIDLLFPFCLLLLLVFWSSVVVPVGALRLLVFVFLLSACCAVCLCRGGVFLRGGYVVSALSMSSLFALCFVAERCFRPCNARCPLSVFLSSCFLSGNGRCAYARLPVRHVCTRPLVLRLRGGGWPLLVSFRSAAPLAQTPDLFCCCFPLPCCCLTMAPKRGERRAAERADREAADRRVRQRLDDVEQRIEEAEAMHRNHDQRISFQESPQRLVLRGFACVGEFFRARGEDFALAKRAFIGAFFQELKEHCGPEVTHHIEEAEGLLADRNGWGVVGVYPTGGSLDESPDGLGGPSPATRFCW